MHEMSLAQSIVEIVENTAQQNQAPSVVSGQTDCRRIGRVEMHALMQGPQRSPRRGRSCRMQRLKLSARREQPGVSNVRKTVPIHRRGEPCPECGSYQLSVNGGDDFRVSELELGDS